MKSCFKIGAIDIALLVGLTIVGIVIVAISGVDEELTSSTQSSTSTSSASSKAAPAQSSTPASNTPSNISSNATPTRFSIDSLQVLTVDEIEAWVEQNELNFEDSVSEKWLGVRGRVRSVEEATFRKGINVFLNPIENEWSAFNVVCELPESDRNVATALRKGQVITVSGVAGTVTMGFSVSIEQCQYESSEG